MLSVLLRGFTLNEGSSKKSAIVMAIWDWKDKKDNEKGKTPDNKW